MVQKGRTHQHDRVLLWTIFGAIACTIVLLWAIEMFSIEQDVMVTSDEVTYALHIRLHRERVPFVSQVAAEDRILYTDAQNGFEFFYPRGWDVVDNGSSYVVFEKTLNEANAGHIFVAIKQKSSKEEFLSYIQQYAHRHTWSSESHEFGGADEHRTLAVVNRAVGFDSSEYTPQLFFGEISPASFIEIGESYTGGMQRDADIAFNEITHSLIFH